MRILHIEDEDYIVAIVRHVCPTIEIGVAQSLIAARYCLARTSFDTLLVDLHLHDSSGIETIEALKPYCLPIIVLTGYDSPELAITCKALGVDDYILKDDLLTIGLSQRIQTVYDKHRLKWHEPCNLALGNFEAIKPYLSTTRAFAALAAI